MKKNKKIGLLSFTDISRKLLSEIWNISGESSEVLLYTFIELFFFKYLSDLEVLTNQYSFHSLLQLYETNNSEEVLEYYAKTVRTYIKEFFPTGIDNTTIINGSIFINKNEIYYAEEFKNLIFQFQNYGKLENIDYGFKTKLFEIFLNGRVAKKNLGQYFTPLKVVQAINQMASSELKEGIKICDPACGVGNFLLDFIKENIAEYFPVVNGKIIPKLEIFGFDKGFDIHERKTIVLAKANMLIYFSELLKKNKNITKELANLSNKSFILETNSILGTLNHPINNEFDLILANPPYSINGFAKLKKEILKSSSLAKYYQLKGIGIESIFIEWIINALKLNGKAFIIIPDGILNRSHDLELRKFILKQCFIDAIISLPLNIFRGVQKKTYILAITKKENKTIIQKSPVFTYLVSEIGESRNRERKSFAIEQNELVEVVELFNQFKQNKDEFSTTDQRCKIQLISKFKNEENWVIDRWWERNELVKLGLSKVENFIKWSELEKIAYETSLRFRDLSISLRNLDSGKKLKFKEVNISDIFIVRRGFKKYTKEFIDKNSGIYPVYFSDSTNSIDTYDYDARCLLLTIAGVCGRISLVDEKFSLSENLACLLPNWSNKNISLEYLQYYLTDKLHVLASGSYGNEKIAIYKLLDFKVEIPVDDNGDFDLVEQTLVVKKANLFFQNKEKAKFDFEFIKEKSVLVDDYLEYKKVLKIKDVFDLSICSNMKKITPSFVERNKGSIPVFGLSKFAKNATYGFIKDNLKGVRYFEDCLTLNSDGSVGKILFRKGRFSISEKVIPLIIKDSYKKLIDIDYIIYVLEKVIEKERFDFVHKITKDKISNLKVEIPLNKKGKIDLDRQKEIAESKRKGEKIKEQLSSELEKIKDSKILWS